MFENSEFGKLSASVHRSGCVDPAPVVGLAHFAIEEGMPRRRVENLLGMSLEQSLKMDKIPAFLGPLLFTKILDDGFGKAPSIRMAEKTPFSFLAGLEKGIFLAPTGRDAMQALAANFCIFHDRLVASFDETESMCRFSFRQEGPEIDNGCCNEVVLSVLVRLMRNVFGQYGQPQEVQMRFDKNGTRHEYDRFFGTSIKFLSEDQSFSIIWKKEDMDWRQPRHDKEVYDLAIERLSRTAALRRQNAQTVDFFELISATNICVRAGVFSVKAVAARAGLGERTAQRIAKRHGFSVGKLIDEARLSVLREQLSQCPNTCAEDLSALLGFSDSRALRRALKSWTGQPLSQVREDPL